MSDLVPYRSYHSVPPPARTDELFLGGVVDAIGDAGKAVGKFAADNPKLIGTALGAAAAPFTGGMSLQAGMTLGSAVGGAASQFKGVGKDPQRERSIARQMMAGRRRTATPSYGTGNTGGYTRAKGGTLRVTGRSHDEGGIRLPGNTEIEGGETVGQAQGGAHAFSSRLKVPGTDMTFADMHEQLTKRGASQDRINQLADLQHQVAGRSSGNQMLRGGGVIEKLTSNPPGVNFNFSESDRLDEGGKYYAIKASETESDDPKYPINSADDVRDAWKLRSHGDYNISQEKLEQRIKRKAREYNVDLPTDDSDENALGGFLAKGGNTGIKPDSGGSQPRMIEKWAREILNSERHRGIDKNQAFAIAWDNAKEHGYAKKKDDEMVLTEKGENWNDKDGNSKAHGGTLSIGGQRKLRPDVQNPDEMSDTVYPGGRYPNPAKKVVAQRSRGGSVDEKIAKLVDEGYDQDQAVAIAHRMEESGQLQDGGPVPGAGLEALPIPEIGDLVSGGGQGIAGSTSVPTTPSGGGGGGFGQFLGQAGNVADKVLPFLPGAINAARGIFGNAEGVDIPRMTIPNTAINKARGLETDIDVDSQLAQAEQAFRSVVANPNVSQAQKQAAFSNLMQQRSQIESQEETKETQLENQRQKMIARLTGQQERAEAKANQEAATREAVSQRKAEAAKQNLLNTGITQLARQRQRQKARQQAMNRNIMSVLASMAGAPDTVREDVLNSILPLIQNEKVKTALEGSISGS